MALLEIKLDSVAAMRTAIGKTIDPVAAAIITELAGADGISITLADKEGDVRLRDLYVLQDTVTTRFNLNIVPTKKLVDRALEVTPDMVTLTPVDGVLNSKTMSAVKEAISVLKNNKDLAVSVRIEPEPGQAKAASRAGADYIEIDTLRYSRAQTYHDRITEVERIASVARAAFKYDLSVAAGGSLTYQNASDIADIEQIELVSVGKSVASKAVLIGFESAVKDMLDIVR